MPYEAHVERVKLAKGYHDITEAAIAQTHAPRVPTNVPLKQNCVGRADFHYSCRWPVNIYVENAYALTEVPRPASPGDSR